MMENMAFKYFSKLYWYAYKNNIRHKTIDKMNSERQITLF